MLGRVVIVDKVNIWSLKIVILQPSVRFVNLSVAAQARVSYRRLS